MQSYYIAILIAFIASFSWGLNSHIMKIGARNEHPIIALVIRASIAFPILLLLLFFIYGIDSISVYFNLKMIFLCSLLAISIIIGDGLYIYSLKFFPVKIILPIAATYPLLTTLLLFLTKSEYITYLTFIGTGLIVIGIALVTGNGKFRLDVPLKSVLFGLGVAFGWGTSVFIAKLILDVQGTNSLSLMAIRTFFIGFISFVFLLKSKSIRTNYFKREKADRMKSIKFFSISAILGWVIGATLLFVSIDSIGAAIPTPITSANPIFATMIGHYSGFEPINKNQFFGIILSTIGIIIIIL